MSDEPGRDVEDERELDERGELQDAGDGARPVPDPEAPRVRPALRISEAAERAGVSRTTIRRALDGGRLPNAWRDDGPHGEPHEGAWHIPVADLLAAGFDLAAGQRARVAVAEPEREAPARELDLLRVEVEQLRRRAAVAEALADERARHVEDLRAVMRALGAGEPEPPPAAAAGPVPRVTPPPVAEPSREVQRPPTRRWWQRRRD